MVGEQTVPEEVVRALPRDETLLWSGRAVRAARWNLGDSASAAMLVFAVGFGVLWQAMAWQAPVWFRLLGVVPTVLVTAFFVRYFVGRRRPRVHYVLSRFPTRPRSCGRCCR
jgi:hypothetical protein